MCACVQAHPGELLSMAPCMGSRLQVAFYATPAEQLAQQHPVVEALLRCCRPRSGCYLCPTEDLANAARLSPSEVQSQPVCQARRGWCQCLPLCCAARVCRLHGGDLEATTAQ